MPRRMSQEPLHQDAGRRSRPELPLRRLQSLLHTHRFADADDGGSSSSGSVRRRGDGNPERPVRACLAGALLVLGAIQRFAVRTRATGVSHVACRIERDCRRRRAVHRRRHPRSHHSAQEHARACRCDRVRLLQNLRPIRAVGQPWGTAPMLRASAKGEFDGVEGRVNRFGQGDVATRLTVDLLGFPQWIPPRS